MSKQRCVLIALLLLACAVQAQNAFTLRSDAQLVFARSHTGVAGLNRMSWEQHFGPDWDLSVSSNLNSTDRIIPTNVQKLWHNGLADVNYRGADFNVHADYRNTVFGASKLLGLYPTWDPLTSQKRLMQHQGTVSAEFDADFLLLGGYVQGKLLSYTPFVPVLDPETFELTGWQKLPGENATDVYTGAVIKVPIVNGLAAHLAMDYKSGTFADKGEYDLNKLNAGLNADYKFLGNASVSASFDWTRRTGAAISNGKTNLLRSTLRLQHRFSNSLAGYVLYINNSCLNDRMKNLRLLANYFRAQVQYSFPSDPTGGSYLLAGGKYSPQNKADAYFVEGDYKVREKIYAGGSLNLQPDWQTLISAKLSYYYTPVNELHLQYSHRQYTPWNNSSQDFGANYLGVGTSFHW